MKNWKTKTSKQKLAWILTMLICINTIPLMVLGINAIEPIEEFGDLSNNPYLVGWIFNIGLATLAWLMGITFKLGNYAKHGYWQKWNEILN
jgi:hypothetical protein